MNDEYTEPGILTRIGWFFWRNWNRLVCATRGHDVKPNYICRRCGLPVATFDEIAALERDIEDLKAELSDEREDRKAFHQHYLEAEADAMALRDEHR